VGKMRGKGQPQAQSEVVVVMAADENAVHLDCDQKLLTWRAGYVRRILYFTDLTRRVVVTIKDRPDEAKTEAYHIGVSE